MGLFSFLPKVERCCFCTRKLNVACIMIDILSMFIAIHEIQIIFLPACEMQYNQSAGRMHAALNVMKWIFFIVNLIFLASSFAYLLGLCWTIQVTADVYMCCGIASAIVSILFAAMIGVQMVYAKCTNPNDVLAIFIYFILWSYFIVVVNSYEMR